MNRDEEVYGPSIPSCSEYDTRSKLKEILSRTGLLEAHLSKKESEPNDEPTTSLPKDQELPAASYTCELPTFEQLCPHLRDQDMKRKFVEDVCVGARLCARVFRVGIMVLEVELVCMLSHFRRYLLSFMRGEKFNIAYDKAKRSYCVNDYVAVTLADKNECHLLQFTIDEDEAILSFKDLPSYCRNAIEDDDDELEPDFSTNEQINTMRKNPNLGEALSVHIDAEWSALKSLSQRLSGGSRESAEKLKREQTRRLAMTHVSRGAELTRENRCFEAIQCFNKALAVDETCADAYCGRGAACAGDSNFPAALSDLKAAMKLEPEHRNALRYFVEVSLAFGKKLEREGNLREAREKYTEALAFAPAERRCTEAVKSIDARLKTTEVIDLCNDEEEDGENSRGRNSQNGEKRRRQSSSSSKINDEKTPEVNRRKLMEMEAFIEKLKRTK